MPDPIYRSLLVTQIVNKVLLHGKRSTAEKIVYTALEIIEQKTGAEPISTLKRAHREHQAAARGQEPSRRWRHLPGARRGPRSPRQHPRHPLGRSATRGSAGRRRWPSASPTSSSMPATASVPR